MILKRLLAAISKSTGILTTSTNLIYYAIDSNYREAMSLAIFGTSRSGTTWLAELLLYLPNYRLIYEPLNPDLYPHATKIIRKLGFLHRRLYVYIHNECAELKNYLYSVIKGKIPTYISPMFYFSEILKSKNLRSFLLKGMIGIPLIKFVNGIRILPWFCREFKVRGIYMIIRHPCAVVESQLSTFGKP